MRSRRASPTAAVGRPVRDGQLGQQLGRRGRLDGDAAGLDAQHNVPGPRRVSRRGAARCGGLPRRGRPPLPGLRRYGFPDPMWTQVQYPAPPPLPTGPKCQRDRGLSASRIDAGQPTGTTRQAGSCPAPGREPERMLRSGSWNQAGVSRGPNPDVRARQARVGAQPLRAGPPIPLSRSESGS